jgi:hypothetical protein
MKSMIAVAVVGLLVAGQAFAANTQQDKMKACNAQAKEKALSGDDRKAFMKDCLSVASEEATQKLTAQQEKMKSCNAEAKTKALKADERKKFMSGCLSGN